MSFPTFHPALAIAGLPDRSASRQTRATMSGRCGPAWQLGNEPPLDVGTPVLPTTRHAVSVRWLGASVLAGIAGALLLGSAIYVSSEGETTFADAAEPAPATQQSPTAPGSGLRKGDKLVRAETIATAKQTFRAPMTLRAGDREVIKVRSFGRLSTGLSLTSGTYATNIPPFNPMRFFDAPTGERAPEAPEAAEAAEVSVVKTDLSLLVLETGGPTLGDDDIAGQLQAESRALATAGSGGGGLPTPFAFLPRAAVAASPGSSQFSRSSDAAFRSIEVRVVPENVSSIVKSGARTSDLAFEERVVTPKRGDTLEAALRGNGATAEEARAISVALGRDRTPEGYQLRMTLAPAGRPGESRPVLRAILYGERGIEAIAAMNDRGAFVSVAPPPSQVASADAPAPAKSDGEGDGDDDEQEGTGARLYDSLYETALKHDLSRQTVEDLVRMFGYDVDFQRRVAPGDSIELFYATDEEGSPDRVEILSATLSVGSDVRHVYRFQNDDGSIDYLDENGRSLKKFLLRKPITEAKMTSGFGSRFHPVLGYSKMHTGVDWGAKIGTPILSAGNGTVIKAEWAGGYGRRTEIQHANGYVTAYNHQSAFARGIAPGARVRQGQVIGYVGSTGLSTGPHVHFEVIINGRFVDPMRIKVPRGKELDGRALVDFNRQREQIDVIEKRGATGNQLASGEAR